MSDTVDSLKKQVTENIASISSLNQQVQAKTNECRSRNVIIDALRRQAAAPIVAPSASPAGGAMSGGHQYHNSLPQSGAVSGPSPSVSHAAPAVGSVPTGIEYKVWPDEKQDPPSWVAPSTMPNTLEELKKAAEGSGGEIARLTKKLQEKTDEYLAKGDTMQALSKASGPRLLPGTVFIPVSHPGGAMSGEAQYHNSPGAMSGGLQYHAPGNLASMGGITVLPAKGAVSTGVYHHAAAPAQPNPGEQPKPAPTTKGTP